MSDSTVALLVLAGVIGLFVWNRLPVGAVALGTVLVLWATDLLTLDEATAGFGDPVVVFIATLFVVSEGIDRAGITAWAGGRLVALAGDSSLRLLVAVMGLCAALTALISLNGAVAALLPMVVVVALRTAQPASRMLMPMVFAGSAGSLLVLTGSPVNIIVSEAADSVGAGAFSYFEFAWVGVPILLGSMALGAVLAPRVLPDRTSRSATSDLSRHAEVLAGYYGIADGFYRLRVREGSPLIGTPPGTLDLSGYPGLTLIGMQAGLDEPQPVRHAIDADDVLVVSGDSDQVSRLAVEQVMAVAMRPLREDAPADLVNREVGVVEVVVPPRSPLVGETVFPGMVRDEELVILAVSHHGNDTGTGPVELRAGDALLLYGSWGAVDTLVDDRDIVVVDSPDLVRRQVPLGPRATQAGVVLVAMVVLLAFGIVPPAVAGILGALGMVLTRVLTSSQAYRAVSWETVVLVGGLIPLSTAIQRSGAGDDIAQVVLDVVGTDEPVLLLAAMFVLTSVMGLVLSNTATVLIVLPIALSAAAEGGVAVQPMLMLLAVAASAALLTPVQTPGNMMVMAPAGYRFGDYWKLGLPLLLLWLAVSLAVIPAVWPL
jgi:di/tricarboxylate transporter